jgi:stalled ribosome rescue protein Dom34
MSSKLVTFNLDIENEQEPKTLTLIDNKKEKLRSSRFTSTSTDNISTKNSIIKRKSRASIFSDLKISNSSTRIDAFGNEITKKGSKNYKVSFIDEISREKIAEVILIENSFSKSNINYKEECKCSSCLIF